MNDERLPRWLINLAIGIFAIVPILFLEIPTLVAIFVLRVNPWYVCLLTFPALLAGVSAAILGMVRRSMLVEYGYEKDRRKVKKEKDEFDAICCPKCNSNIILEDDDKELGEVDCPLCDYVISLSKFKKYIKHYEW